MAMQKPKKQRRFQDGGYLLDSSGNRVKSGSGEDIMTGSGREEAETQKRMQAAEAKLAGEVQDMMKAKAAPAEQPSKASDGDVDERDRRMEAAASAPSRMPTRPGQGAVKAKPSIAKPAAKKKETSVESAVMASEDRRRQKSAVINDEDRKRQSSRSAVMTDEARKRRAGKEAAFQRAQAEAKTPEGKAKLDERIKGQAIKRYAPEAELIGGAALKPLSALAKRLAKPKIQEYKPTMLPAPKAAAKADTKALESPRPKLSYDKRGMKDKERAERAAKREREKDFDNIQRGGRLTGGRDIELKKGGSVSASKRADGIAQRGKTRGRVY